MPGGLDDDLAARLSASRPPSAVGSTPLSFGLSSTRTGATASVRSLRTVAWPSLPRPQTPTCVPPACAGRTSRASCAGRVMRSTKEYAGGDEAGADRVPHGLDLRLGRRVGAAGDLGREFLQQRACPARSGLLGGEHDRGAALVDLADALERLGARAEQRLELRLQLRVVERLRPAAAAIGREDRPELFRRHERGQDQVDEAALVALAAPVVEAAPGVDVKGPVTAAERAVVLRQVRRTAPPPTARCGRGARRSSRAGPRDRP